MKFLFSLSLKAKFILIGAAMFIFVGAIIGNQIYSRTMVNKAVADIMNTKVQAKVTTLEIAADTNYISRLTRNIMLGSNYEKDMKKFVARQKSVEESYAKYETFGLNSEQKQIVAMAKKYSDEFIGKCREILENGKDMPASERFKLYEVYKVEATPPAEESRKYFGQLIKFIDEGYDHAVDGFLKDLQSDSNVMNVFSLFSLVFIIVLLVLFYIVTAKPLVDIVKVMENLSHGGGETSLPECLNYQTILKQKRVLSKGLQYNLINI